MQSFKKNERLANYRLQSMLFRKGNSFFNYPFKVQWLTISEKDQDKLLPTSFQQSKNDFFYYPAKCMLAVSKRHLKSAVERNRVKRLAREAYRKNKTDFYAFLKSRGLFAMVAFVYTAKEVMTYNKIEPAMQHALVRLQEKAKPVDANNLRGMDSKRSTQ